MSITPAAQPPNTENIMNAMLAKAVKPDAVGAVPVSNGTPAPVQVTPPVTQPAPLPPVSAPEPPAQPQPDYVETNFFTEEEAEVHVEQPLETVADEEPDMSDVPDTDQPVAANWKKARAALKEERIAKKKLEKELRAAQEERDAWAEGKKIPEVLTAKDAKIQELQKYEAQVNGRLSEEYQELVVKPLASNTAEFTKLAEDYGIAPESRQALVNKIVSTENEKERNALITKYFPDAIGATKVKELVLKAHELGQIAIDMEKKPLETHQTLQAQYAEKLKVEDVKRTEVFEHVSKNAWSAALEKTAQEGIYPQLIMDPTNPEHNKIVERNQHRAAIQFGALMKELKAGGMKNIPDKVAQGMARSILLAMGSVGAHKEVQRLSQELADIKRSSSVQTTYFRPSSNGNGGGVHIPAAPANSPKTPQEAGKLASASLNAMNGKR
jgi:hypothetical protein